MARPTDSAEWASGVGRRTEPTAGEKGNGFVEATRSPAKKANWIVGVIADWIAWLETVTTAGVASDWVYETPPSHQIILAPSTAQPLDTSLGWSMNNAGSGWDSPSTPDESTLCYSVRLPHGSTITAVHVLVDPAAARGAGDRMELEVWHEGLDYSSPSVGAGAGQLGSTVEDDGTAALQVLAVTGLSQAINGADEYVNVLVRCGLAGGVGADTVYPVRVTFTDPGPRNY